MCVCVCVYVLSFISIFVVLQLFSVAKHTGRSKPGSKTV